MQKKIGKTIKNRLNAQPLSNFIQEISKFGKHFFTLIFSYVLTELYRMKLGVTIALKT